MSPWLLRTVWLLSLVICPTGMFIVSLIYPNAPMSHEALPVNSMASVWLDILLVTHTCLSLAAAVGVFFLARWWPWRLLMCVGIVLCFYVTIPFAMP